MDASGTGLTPTCNAGRTRLTILIDWQSPGTSTVSARRPAISQTGKTQGTGALPGDDGTVCGCVMLNCQQDLRYDCAHLANHDEVYKGLHNRRDSVGEIFPYQPVFVATHALLEVAEFIG